MTEYPRNGIFTVMITENIWLCKLYCLCPHLKFSVLALILAVIFLTYKRQK